MESIKSIYYIYNCGLENDRYLGNKINFRNGVFILLFEIIAIIFSRRSAVEVSNVAWINGNRNYEILFEDVEDIYYIYHGREFTQLRSFISKNTILSNFSRLNRVFVLIGAVRTYLKGKSYGVKNFIYWLEFFFIYSALHSMRVDKIITPHIYDRQATWISLIASSLKVKYEIIQHGLVYSVDRIPNKIFCSKVSVFDKKQLELFKEYIIQNNDCVYNVVRLKSAIEFAMYNNVEDTLIIGVATQCNPIAIEKIIKGLLTLNISMKIILMLHPLENKNAYKNYSNESRVIVESKKKYIDIDILITENSTIVWDYINCGFMGKIITVDNTQRRDSLSGLDGIINLESVEQLLPIVMNLDLLYK